MEVTENASPVVSLAVTPPGGSKSGAVLLIDASNSMKGAPIQGATVAARAFLDERKANLPAAIIAFNPNINVLSEFTTDKAALDAAVAETPTTAEGTHIYDAIIEASSMARDAGQERTTFVLLSDGANFDTSNSSLAEALAAADEANVRDHLDRAQVGSVHTGDAARPSHAGRAAAYIEADNPAALAAIYTEIGQQLSREYELTYRSLLPPLEKANVQVKVVGYAPASATYTTPALDIMPQGTFETSWIDEVITSPWLMIFVVVSVLALIGFAIFSAIDVRNRSLRRRMAAYVTVPSEEESRMRRTEVAQILADTAQRTVGGQRWWQRFETDVELGGFNLSALAIAGWTIVGGIVVSLGTALWFQSLWGLLAGLAAPFVTRWFVSRRVAEDA